MTEDTRIKRLRMRSWRRGTKEMDLILGPFADSHAAGLDGAMLDRYEALLEENDQDLFAWVLARVNGREAAIPPELLDILDVVIADAVVRLRVLDKI